MLKSDAKKKVLVAVTGSIAAYKACYLVSKLVQNSFDVEVVVSRAALEFIGAASFEGLTGKPIHSDLYSSGQMMGHIDLARWADLIVVAPCTANTLNKLSAGIADDLIGSLFLAHDFKKPFVLAPAMNVAMYKNPITQSSISKLSSLGIQILKTEEGLLACGEVGEGRLLDVDQIFQEIQKLCIQKNGKRVLVTSGGTSEPIDNVRSIRNFSTGATAATIANEFALQGFDVDYLHAEGSGACALASENLSFVTFLDLETKFFELLKNRDYSAVVHAAAVGDFSLHEVSVEGKPINPNSFAKISSSQAPNLNLNLKKNPKLIDSIKNKLKDSSLTKVIGFKLTSTAMEDEQAAAIDRLQESSQVDLIVHNDKQQLDIKSQKHLFNIYRKKQHTTQLSGAKQLADWLVQYVQESAK